MRHIITTACLAPIWLPFLAVAMVWYVVLAIPYVFYLLLWILRRKIKSNSEGHGRAVARTVHPLVVHSELEDK